MSVVESTTVITIAATGGGLQWSASSARRGFLVGFLFYVAASFLLAVWT